MFLNLRRASIFFWIFWNVWIFTSFFFECPYFSLL